MLSQTLLGSWSGVTPPYWAPIQLPIQEEKRHSGNVSLFPLRKFCPLNLREKFCAFIFICLEDPFVKIIPENLMGWTQTQKCYFGKPGSCFSLHPLWCSLKLPPGLGYCGLEITALGNWWGQAFLHEEFSTREPSVHTQPRAAHLEWNEGFHCVFNVWVLI